jgi:hypothetical protein
MSPQFNNMNELTSYLNAMEDRVKILENQNEALKQSIPESLANAARALPRTRLLSRSFFERALTVWGHNFVIQLIISLVLLCVVLFIIMLVPGLVAYLYNLYQGTVIP